MTSDLSKSLILDATSFSKISSSPGLINLEILSLPKTIDFSVDYLRSGLPRDSYARAKVNRVGRRYASVHVEAWQDHRDRLFAQGTGHFLMPQPN